MVGLPTSGADHFAKPPEGDVELGAKSAMKDADTLLLGGFPQVIQLHGLAVLVYCVRVIVEHASVFGGRADGVVECAGERGEIAVSHGRQLLHFFRLQAATRFADLKVPAL